MHKRAKGVTLTEIMISGVLLVLILTLLYQILIPTQRFWLLGDARTEAQLNAQLGFRMLMKELQSSTFNSITVSTNPKAISFASALDSSGTMYFTSTGRLIWQKYIIYFLSSARLLRKEVTVSGNVPSSTPTPLTSAQLTSYCTTPNTRNIALDVSNLSFTLQSALYGVDLELSTTTTSLGKTNSYTIKKLITFEN